MNIDGYTRSLIERVAEQESRLADVKRLLSDRLIEISGLSVGQTLENDAGLHYEIESAHGYASGSGARIVLLCRRVWRTGRRVGRRAASVTHLSWPSSDLRVADEPEET